MPILNKLFGRRPGPPRPDPRQLLEALRAFLQADTWAESRRILEAHPELLADEADTLLGMLIQAQEEARRYLEEHRALLRRCREAGIPRAFAEKMLSPEALAAAEAAGLTPEQALEMARLAAEMPSELLEALAELAASGAEIRSPEDLERLLSERPDLRQRREEAARRAAGAAPLLQTLQEFIQASTWTESQRIVEQHPELLGDEADTLLGQLVEAARGQGDEDAARVLEEHRALLRRCREVGVAEAFAAKMLPPEAQERAAALGLTAEQALEMARLAAEMPSELLEALAELAARGAEIRSPEDLERLLSERPDLRQRLEEAARRAAGAVPLLQTLQEFIQASTWAESRRILEAHPELLADEADTLLGMLIQAQEDEDARRYLEEHRALLRRCREVGIPRAFAEKMLSPEALAAAEAAGLTPEQALEMARLAAAIPPDLQEILAELAASGVEINSPEDLERLLEARPDLRERLVRATGILPAPSAEEIRLHPLYLLAESVLRGECSLEDARQAATAPQALDALDDEAIKRMDDYIIALSRDPTRPTETRVLAYLLAELNHAAARALPASPPIRAYTANTLGNRINDYPFKSPAHLERRVEAYLEALAIWQERGDARQVAMLQNNLGNAYSDLAQVRDREENLGQAIRAYEEALTVYTPDKAPLEYATTQNNLGTAYSHLAQVRDREENLGRAIRAYEEALTVYTPDKAPLEYATTQNNLGTAYSDLAQVRDREENLGRAIRAYEEALTVYTPDKAPLGYATTQNNLGNAYSDLAQVRDREENLGRAIRAYEEALTVYTPDKAPLEYATTQNNLGNAYSHLAQVRDREENLGRAIRAYEEALTVYTPDKAPLDFAMTQNNLGNAYSHLAQVRDREENLGRAIRAYEEALTVYTPDKAPLDFAMTQNNLGIAYSHLAQVRDREENLGRAIRAYEEALRFRTPDKAPLDFAMTQNNLGNAYLRLAQVRDREENLGRAIRAYEEALEVVDDFFLAASVGAQVGLQQEWAGLYARAVSAYLQAGRPAPALALAEGAKSRILTALLGRGDLPALPALPPALVEQERDLASRLAALDAAAFARLGISTTEEGPAAALRRLEERRSLMNRLRTLWEKMEGYGEDAVAYVALRRGDRPSWEHLARLAEDLGPETALLSLFTAGDRTLLFILRAGWEAPRVAEEALDGPAWQDLMRRFLREVHAFDPTGRRGETWHAPLRPLLEAARPHLSGARRAIFAPESYGHLLPWPALLADDLPTTTIPALGLLAPLRRRPASGEGGALVVGNPLGDLPYAETEARQVAALLETPPLLGPKATREAVLAQLSAPLRMAHFATHAYFAPGSPMDSGIVLADGVLTAREILERGLHVPPFLALSACQTGMAERMGGDELAGLSQALLYAGARSLLVSLWAVNDLATAHLMTEFYRRWLEEGEEKTTALREAMVATRAARPHWTSTYYWGAFTLVGD